MNNWGSKTFSSQSTDTQAHPILLVLEGWHGNDKLRVWQVYVYAC